MAEIKFARMKITDPDKLKAACDAYFAEVDASPARECMSGRNMVLKKLPPTPAGLARRLGISTATLGKYLRGEVSFPDSVSKKTEAELLRVLTDARMRIEEEITQRALIGELDNAVSRQVMGMLGYNRSMDEAGEEANNKVLVLVQGASTEEIKNWSK